MTFRRHALGGACLLVSLLPMAVLRAQAAAPLSQTAAPPTSAASGAAAPETGLTLDDAISRAVANEPAFAAASAEQRALALERTNAKASLLPSATYHNQAIYTQPNGVAASRIGQTANAPSPIFIANNAVREYASQGVFNETIGLAQVGAIRLANANALRSEAELEIARRGLIATVVGLYYGVSAGTDRIAVAQRALITLWM